MILRETTKFRYENGAPSKFYGCSRYPDCKATHGAHPDGAPYGRPADKETKRARQEAHIAFDAWVGRNSYTKDYAYRRLAKILGIEEVEAHMGMMDKETCEAVVRHCS